MIKVTEKHMCSGCHACFNICPKNCITMKDDEEGFLYPVVNESACVDCGACEDVCPIINKKEVDKSQQNIATYAAYTKNEDVRKNSSSGGLFTEIATYVISCGGVVFGSALDKDLKVKHICVDNLADLHKLRGSKYVQSTIGETYREAKKYLENGVKVLFTGTPCQIGGLYSYLRHSYDNLITQDIICHGVPSLAVWDSYVKHIESKNNAVVKNAYFRDKSLGWKTFSMRLEFENGEFYSNKSNADAYMKHFLTNRCLRYSCYNCSFKSKVRQSDITLADLWGAKSVISWTDDDKGVSLVVVNSEKGQALFNEISSKIEFENVNLDMAIEHNSAMVSSVKMPKERHTFIEDVRKKGFEKASKKYISPSFWCRLRRKIGSIMRKR